MLSNDLKSLSSWLGDVIQGRTVPTADALRLFSVNLKEAVEKAEQLECTCVAQAVRLTRAQVGENVIPFPVHSCLEHDHA